MSFADQLGSGNPSRTNPRGYQPPQRGLSQNGSFTGTSSSSNGRSYGNDSYDQSVRIVSENVRQLSVNVNQIKSFSDTLGTTRDALENREELRRLIDSSRGLATDTNEALKRMSPSGGPDDKTRKIQQQKLAKDFENVLKKFGEISKYAAEKEKSTPLPQKAPPKQQQEHNSIISYYEDDNDLEKQGLIETQRVQQLQLDNERQFMDALIADREQGIKEIEKTVVEVNEIFRDLSHLVQEQGVMIDNIESNIEESVVKTTDGVEELRKANEYQKSSRNKMCCLALIILIVAAIIVLVVYFVIIK